MLASPLAMSQNYKETLNLPKTDFPMKANLAAREPGDPREMGDDGLYRANPKLRADAELFVLCTTARLLPMATSTWAPRSTRSSRISS